jgi:hypothetical protein
MDDIRLQALHGSNKTAEKQYVAAASFIEVHDVYATVGPDFWLKATASVESYDSDVEFVLAETHGEIDQLTLGSAAIKAPNEEYYSRLHSGRHDFRGASYAIHMRTFQPRLKHQNIPK